MSPALTGTSRLAERIRQARSLGDLSENFDYQDAKRQQGFVAGKIADLQAILDRASIVEETGPGAEVVGMGSKVSLRDIDYDGWTTVELYPYETSAAGVAQKAYNHLLPLAEK